MYPCSSTGWSAGFLNRGLCVRSAPGVLGRWRSWQRGCLTSTRSGVRTPHAPPTGRSVVEHAADNREVAGSSPAPSTEEWSSGR